MTKLCGALLLLGALVPWGGALTAQGTVQREGTTVLLVRHAETQEDGSNDPSLSEAGRTRVERLVATLGSLPLSGVHSTPYRRTAQTAAPVAAAHGLPVQEYDPQQLSALAARLVQAGGTHLVVGHSNTVPPLVRALGGDAGAPFGESEHGRLYVLVIDGSDVETLLLHVPER